jgi:hypothetical protein
MRKTIDLSKADIKKIEEYGQAKGIKTFTKSVQGIIDEFDGASVSDENFALLADALVELDKKIDLIISNLPAPKSAGEVK